MIVLGTINVDVHVQSYHDSIKYLSLSHSLSLSLSLTHTHTHTHTHTLIQSLMLNIERDCLGQHSSLLTPDPATTSQTDEPIRLLTLILGRQIQHLPWESLPVLTDQVVYRMPSLPFMAAHSVMVSY